MSVIIVGSVQNLYSKLLFSQSYQLVMSCVNPDMLDKTRAHIARLYKNRTRDNIFGMMSGKTFFVQCYTLIRLFLLVTT